MRLDRMDASAAECEVGVYQALFINWDVTCGSLCLHHCVLGNE